MAMPDDVSGPARPASGSSPRRKKRHDRWSPLRIPNYVVAIAWKLSVRPLTLFVVSLVALATACAGLILPQVPSQLMEDSAAMSRWMLAASAEYGWFGSAFRALELFNVSHSTWLRALLGIITLILFIQLADQIGRMLLLVRLNQTVRTVRGTYNYPIPLRTYAPLFRLRSTITGLSETFEKDLTSRMAQSFEQTLKCTVPSSSQHTGPGEAELNAVATSPANRSAETHTNGSSASDVPAMSEGDNDSQHSELRMLGINAPVAGYLRPLLPAGLLLSLIAIWLVVTFGWKVTTPLMVPGDSYSSVHNVIVDYQLPVVATDENEAVAPSVTVARGPTTVQSMITTFGNTYLGNIRLHAATASPGLVVRTEDGSAILSSPGQGNRVSAIGLAFPTVGSEETILLPDALAGLRIVRQTESLENVSNAFMVETYHSSIAQPVERFEFDGTTTIPIRTGSTSVVLEFQTAPAIYVQARYVPGTWLLWPAALLVILGCIGLARRPEFVIVQAFPWTPSHLLLILQSNRSSSIERVMSKLNDDVDGEETRPSAPVQEALPKPGSSGTV